MPCNPTQVEVSNYTQQVIETDASEIKSVLKLQKSPVHVKKDVVNAWRKRLHERRIMRASALGMAWLVLAGTLVSLLTRRTD